MVGAFSRQLRKQRFRRRLTLFPVQRPVATGPQPCLHTELKRRAVDVASDWRRGGMFDAREAARLVNFPVFETLKVDGYLLYPGLPAAPGLNIKFAPGPWLVLGVNGLGKSTLLLMLRQVLTGPARTRAAGFAGERLDVQQTDPRFFASRVLDSAKTATASIEVRFGTSVLSVKRQLSDLALLEASLKTPDGNQTSADDIPYRELLAKAMNLANFEDALRVIDRVTFFLEAREALIWDTAAQFELFRAILLPQHSGELRKLESNIVSSDSLARNLNNTIFSLTKRRDAHMQRNTQAAGVRAQLAASTAKLEEAEAKEGKLQRQLEECDERRSDARTETKRADREAVDATSAYERIKYEVLRHAFVKIPATDQYIFLKIITDRVCIACNNSAENFAKELEQRRQNNRCLVCGQPRHQSETIVTTTAALQEKAETAYATLMKVRQEQEELKAKFAAAEEAYLAADRELDECRQVVDTLSREVRRLRGKLPSADQAELTRDEGRLTAFRHEVTRFRKERDDAEEKISSLITSLTTATEAIRERLVSSFQTRADEFFAERVRLVYAPRKDRIGQTGRVFEFPGFEVEMTSGATQSQFIRRRADQVSLSQREYLDMIFRISIIETVGRAQGSFVTDGPEGSLDAVFAVRAGDLFANLTTSSSKNSVIMACNVVEGQFIPNTLRNYATSDKRKARLVNLLELGSPTSALNDLRPEYQAAIDTILAQPAR